MSEVSGAMFVDSSADICLVDAVFDSAAGHLNVQHARLVSAAIWMLENTREWQGDGLWTPEAYIRWRTGVAPATASKVVDVARRAAEFPDCMATFDRGELSLDQLAPIMRHAPGWSDAQISGLAPRCTVAQISKIARQYPWDTDTCVANDGSDSGDDCENDGNNDAGSADVQDDDGTSAERPDNLVQPPDEAWFGWDDHGRFRLSLNVGADSGMLIEAALIEARDSCFQAGDTSVDTVDAVIEVANRSFDAIPSDDRRNRYRVNLHVRNDGSASDSRGRPMPNAPAERITCDALLSPINWEDGVPVSVGRSQHIVPDRTRRIIEHRDGGCRVPGCSHDRFVEVHHIVHWSANGPTDTWNLICLCPKHHRLHHQGRLGISGNADLAHGMKFTDGSGRTLTESGTRPSPVGASPPPIDGTWEHPLGERLDFRWLYFNDDPKRPAPLG